MIPILATWYCPNCGLTAQLPPLKPGQTHLHTCPKLAMLSAPMIPEGIAAKVERRDREDYEGPDTGHTQLDGNGRPVMSVVTTRDNGTDAIVFAPTATMRADLGD
jgi:hypothetical protein